MGIHKLTSSIITGAVTLACARASYQQVDLSSQINADLNNTGAYGGGNNFPLGNTTLTVAGIPLYLAQVSASNGDTGVIQSTPGQTTTFKLTGLSISGATDIYTLVNSLWGTAPDTVGEIDVFGTGGASYTYDYTEGFNVRDHYNNIYNDTVTDPTIVSTYFSNGSISGTTTGGVTGGGPNRLDMQTIVLPSIFASNTITEIDFKGYGYEPIGSPFLAAMTVQTVPEPAPFATVGLGALFLIRRRRR